MECNYRETDTIADDVMIEHANCLDTEMVKHIPGEGKFCLVSNMHALEIISVGLEENNYEHEPANYNWPP